MRKLAVGIGMTMWLGCMAVTCAVAMASEQQVIVEGAQRAGETVRVSGQRVPLLHALEQIVPASYSVNVPNAGAWADTPVSWHAGGSFVRVLGEMLSANPQLQARVNTDLRMVTVSAVPQRAMTTDAPQRADANANAREPATGGAPIDTAAQRASGPAVTAAAPPASLAPDESAVSAPLSAVNTQSSSAATSKPPTTPASAHGMPPLLAPAAALPATPAASIAVAGPPGQPLTQGMPPTGADTASAPQAQQVWELRESDGSVRNALQRWAREAGWQFVWDVPTDFTVDANATIHGSLDEALREVVDALSNAQVPIQIVMYKGNRVLRVISKGAG
ncbi:MULTISPECIES: toxin co-regulated pilus biosynthesis Q family protein [Paraburkholderia]|uniref:toxin co-regulated pilus biosynthesis Q family protein n=1 Tax=Paraburkholderia TaxID=1822464 RepID=UPI0003A4AA6D|nr:MULTISPECIES: toxin co-regulated pilus biosynthesis Q family protein [Paraburkholderia]